MEFIHIIGIIAVLCRAAASSISKDSEEDFDYETTEEELGMVLVLPLTFLYIAWDSKNSRPIIQFNEEGEEVLITLDTPIEGVIFYGVIDLIINILLIISIIF